MNPIHPFPQIHTLLHSFANLTRLSYSVFGFCGSSPNHCTITCDSDWGACIPAADSSSDTTAATQPTPSPVDDDCLFSFKIPAYCAAIPNFTLATCDVVASACKSMADSCSQSVFDEIDVGSEVDVGSVDQCQRFFAVCGQLTEVCSGLGGLGL